MSIISANNLANENENNENGYQWLMAAVFNG